MENAIGDDKPNEDDVEKLVPSQGAYLASFSVLFFSGITGGLIGFAMMKVFFPSLGGIGRAIGTCLICALIVYGVSIITSLGLSASVEWKSRKSLGPEKSRPSRLVRQENRD